MVYGEFEGQKRQMRLLLDAKTGEQLCGEEVQPDGTPMAGAKPANEANPPGTTPTPAPTATPAPTPMPGDASACAATAWRSPAGAGGR